MSALLKEDINILNTNQGRIYIYDLLSFLFGHTPEKEQLLYLLKSDSLLTLGKVNEGARVIYEFMQDFDDEDFIKLKHEYNRLFIGPDILPAPLWESVYLSHDHAMFGEETLLVRQAYKEFGLSFVRLNNEPDDHLVTELEFMSTLINRMNNESEQKEKLLRLIEGQISFLEDHLLKWVPNFCELLINATKCELYRGAAMLLNEFLPCDLDLAIHLREVLNDD